MDAVLFSQVCNIADKKGLMSGLFEGSWRMIRHDPNSVANCLIAVCERGGYTVRAELTTYATGFDTHYSLCGYDDRLLLQLDAPFVACHPGPRPACARERWQEWSMLDDHDAFDIVRQLMNAFVPRMSDADLQDPNAPYVAVILLDLLVRLELLVDCAIAA